LLNPELAEVEVEVGLVGLWGFLTIVARLTSISSEVSLISSNSKLGIRWALLLPTSSGPDERIGREFGLAGEGVTGLSSSSVDWPDVEASLEGIRI
jgi:hypothetical protein